MIPEIDMMEQLQNFPAGQAPLEEIGRRVVYRESDGADFQVERVEARTTQGMEIHFHVASVKDGRRGAVCVAYRRGAHASSYVLLGQHWRTAIGCWQWEFPRGMGEKDETSVQTAIREFREETGIVVKGDDVHIMQDIHADSGILRDMVSIAVIDCETVPTDSTDWELAGLRWISSRVFEDMIASGKISDGLTLAAWAVARREVMRADDGREDL